MSNAPIADKGHLYSIEALKRYWPVNEQLVYRLPVALQSLPVEHVPPKTRLISLPEWACDVGVDGSLLVPIQFVGQGQGPSWSRVDWLNVVFWYLNGIAERTFEKRHGCIHSYSSRLKGWDHRLWERAWVNRIALFIRRWAAQRQGTNEETLFGPLPAPEVVLTHDVDAVAKTMMIRVKQVAFHTFNALRSLSRGRLKGAFSKSIEAVRFLFGRDDYWCFEQIMSLEESCQRRSIFNFYGGRGGWRRHPKYLLMDPSYCVSDERIKQQLRRLKAGGWTVGLHPSFDAWADAERMTEERIRLEQALDAPVATCRQHWLRFSWEHTWMAQQEAGLAADTSLGFNDRPAFRNGAALSFHPWDFTREQPMRLEITPMVLMDSHLYDYADSDDDQRQRLCDYWLDELSSVGGVATVIWHQRVMCRDYGWAKGYENLLEDVQRL